VLQFPFISVGWKRCHGALRGLGSRGRGTGPEEVGVPLPQHLHILQMQDRKVEVSLEVLFLLLRWWSAPVERWQGEVRELQEMVTDLREVVELKKKGKGKGKEKEEDAEE